MQALRYVGRGRSRFVDAGGEGVEAVGHIAPAVFDFGRGEIIALCVHGGVTGFICWSYGPSGASETALNIIEFDVHVPRSQPLGM